MSLKLVIAISHVDLRQAMRLMGWIGFLSSKNGNSMLGESCLLVVSRRATQFEEKFKQLCWLTAKIFREARCYVPDTEHEPGWPGAANWMFAQSLLHVEQNFGDDIFFLEPDGVPIRPSWWEEIEGEWSTARAEGKNFMGNLVPHHQNHMTGIAVYSAEWRKYAPALAECPDIYAWDTYAAPQVLPHMHQTNLIQHLFHRHEPGWSIPCLGALDGRSCVFHQDKHGKLIYLLDTQRYGGECGEHPLFSYRGLEGRELAMRKFYYSQNATLPKKAHNIEIRFEQLEPFGGAIPGAYTTEDEGEQMALVELTSNPATGVSEISQEDWEKATKKKSPSSLNPPTSSPFKSSLPAAAMLPTPSRSPAELVAEPSGQPIDSKPVKVENINDVLKVDTVVPSQLGPKSARPRKPTSQPATP